MNKKFRRALEHWLRTHPDPSGVEGLFTEPINPAVVGRQATFGAAVLDTAAWMASHGWAGVGAGDRHIYASWLLQKRADYERQGTRA